MGTPRFEAVNLNESGGKVPNRFFIGGDKIALLIAASGHATSLDVARPDAP